MQTDRSGTQIGCAAASERSITLSRRVGSQTSPPICTPTPSGPRWTSVSTIDASAWCATARPSRYQIPAIPHILHPPLQLHKMTSCQDKYSHLHAISLRTPAQAPGALMSHRVDSIPTRPPYLCLIPALGPAKPFVGIAGVVSRAEVRQSERYHARGVCTVHQRIDAARPQFAEQADR